MGDRPTSRTIITRRNGSTNRIYGSGRPKATSMGKQTYTFKRRFKNMIQSTDMNNSKIIFKRYPQDPENMNQIIGQMASGVGKSEDYILPYHSLCWIKNTQKEVIQSATHYRIASLGFEIKEITCGAVKRGEDIPIASHFSYFDVYIDHGNYVGYGNLRKITSVPNKGYTLPEPSVAEDALLPKYEYSYNIPIDYLRRLGHNFEEGGDAVLTVPAIDLHDWRDQDSNKARLGQGDHFYHGWENPSSSRHPLTNVTTSGITTFHGNLFNSSNGTQSMEQQLITNFPTMEDPPPNVYLHCPWIIRPDDSLTTLHFNFEVTYDATVELWYDQFDHPQRCITTNSGFNFHPSQQSNLTVPMRHLHGNTVKRVQHRITNRFNSTHTDT